MSDLLLAVIMYLTGGVDPIRPAPMVIQPGAIETLEGYTPAPTILYTADWGR